jgi:hypothetical protein
MRIIARGWGRDQGEKEIVNVSLGEAVDPPGPGDYYSLGQAYLQVEDPYIRKLAKAKIAAGTEEVRMGGRYLLRVELTREEIAKLFYATHNGDLVHTFRSLLEDEERQEDEEEQRQEAERRAAVLARFRRSAARRERRELLEQFGEKFASLNKQDGTARATPEAEPE